ncbi:class I SAM-dependent methyltransferase [Pontibacter sp. JH31]|uniref:Class I SAM-dependent methyltransferase n=1 Tax=Pontibacter aquaedesilientis TaxID=2766980 RepID=A0ABR7XJD5_9BACT|nr:class I SAM-dependent methyltransferase [Pontibacter aquaedesilientis]MBD1398391.1 class I SAM-dependent methyltransferase [Pontibacter aquaedesilientis]
MVHSQLPLNIRLHLFELEDQPWFPHIFRQGMLDFLRFMISKLRVYHAAIPLLEEMLRRSGQMHFTDLCSGAGGGIEGIRQDLSQRMGEPVRVSLSDLYPNMAAYRFLQKQSGGLIGFIASPVDATKVPPQITGLRTMFSSFHHFRPNQAVAILQDAANQRVPIGILEGGGKTWGELLIFLLTFPFIILAVTPFIRPFKLNRLFFTYLIPVIPLGIMWDGFVSLFRLYNPRMLDQLVAKVQTPPGYTWRSGIVGKGLGKRVIYLVGYPD